jgi:hypothetical protein
MNEVLATHARITASDRVLDADSGYGGTGIWLAKNIRCTVLGANIAMNQTGQSRAWAQQKGVADKVKLSGAGLCRYSPGSGFLRCVLGPPLSRWSQSGPKLAVVRLVSHPINAAQSIFFLVGLTGFEPATT